MTMHYALVWFIWFLFTYVVLHSLAQIGISVLTYGIIRRDAQFRRAEIDEFLLTGLEPPISVVIPAYNEEATIVTSVRSMLQLRYSEHEIIVVNDGSRDATLQQLVKAFDLETFPQAYHARLRTQRVRAAYRSASHPRLRVLDKDNGGKADAINCGINAACYPLFCCVDADSILDRDSLLRVVQPFIEDASTVACGGTVRIANGCVVKDGNLLRAALPSSWLARFQIVEYLRGFLFGRMGWSRPNGLLIISGAFGVMRKDTVIEVGGYRHQTIGEDMELIVRMHRLLGKKGQPYRITYVPEPVCWTQAPEDRRTIKNQRVRWQRGLSESLWLNRGLLFAWPPRVAGWIAFPYFLLFEWFAPLLEFLGYFVLAWLLATDAVRVDTAALFIAIALGFGLLQSTLALLLEELSFHVYPRKRDLLLLFAGSVLENFGYRQLNVLWRLIGTWQWLRGKQGGWGAMQRQTMETKAPGPTRALGAPQPDP
ncbi:MAG: glycosyltransferase family 2 protein [Burkholderiales bacterium]|nr:glycosyltransferase family 2 protein [Burkholderiales bacterium]